MITARHPQSTPLESDHDGQAKPSKGGSSMARKNEQAKPRGARGARGPRGVQGRRGPAGSPGPGREAVIQLGEVLSRVTQELEDVQRTLKVQFTRIAELQAELDEFRRALYQSH